MKKNPRPRMQRLSHFPWIAALFLALLAFSTSPLASPAVALLCGLAFGLRLPHPFPSAAGRWTTRLLQASVVGLGFGMNLGEVARAGRAGFLYTAIGIVLVISAGIALGRALSVGRTERFLIAIGTAICGGSAIAAVGPLVEAAPEQMAISLGTVFLLNAAALVLFPLLGAAAGLTQTQFGLWSALAIHDTSSVVGATLKYGPVALAVGTTVKLARALWIVPLSLAAAARRPAGARLRLPWFIPLFCGAAALNTLLPAGAPVYGLLKRLSIAGLSATLFLIGSAISRSSLRRVGLRPLLQGLLLWILVAATSFALIRAHWLSL